MFLLNQVLNHDNNKDSMEITGFMIVRKPEQNFDPENRGAFSSSVPCLDSIVYGGVDRMPWFDIDEEKYNGSLPEDIKQIYSGIKRENSDIVSGIEVCRNYNDAIQLLQFSNRNQALNELIAISSPKLLQIKGGMGLAQDNIEWMGYDVVSLGWWSLLREGLFGHPQYFNEWVIHLNQNGLFATSDIVEEYSNTYKIASKKYDEVEELPEEIYGVDAIKVGRVLVG